MEEVGKQYGSIEHRLDLISSSTLLRLSMILRMRCSAKNFFHKVDHDAIIDSKSRRSYRYRQSDFLKLALSVTSIYTFAFSLYAVNP